MNSTMKWLLAAAASLTLAACGGGGGSSGAAPGSPGGPAPTGTPTMVVSVVGANGSPTNSISIASAQTVRAQLRDAQGLPVSGRVVNFTVEGDQVRVTPASALTNDQGIASVAIAPTSITSAGATRVRAEAQLGTSPVSGEAEFAIQVVNLSLSPITLGSAVLPSGGNTSVSVDALVGTAPTTLPVNVQIKATCGRINEQDATVGVTVATDGNGRVSVSYRAVSLDGSLCRGRVSVSASATGIEGRTASVEVADPTPNALTFISAASPQIFVAGAGLQEQTTARFRVLAGVTPLANVRVRFSLNVNPGGAGLGSAGQSAPVELTTDSNGEVLVSIFSGSIPGPVKVRAELVANPSVFAETQNLTIASGPPSQRFMSFSVQTFNIEGWNIDGTSTRLSIRVADRQGNPVANGTVVNLTAEGGQVQSSCATALVDGVSLCNVNFISQNPRPANGRATVLAYVAGTKDYLDVNFNNLYDSNVDTILNQGDAFRDDDESGTFSSGEFTIPRGGQLACVGSGGAFPARQNTCDSSLATTVRQQTVIMFSSSSPSLLTTSLSAGAVNFTLGSLDNPLLPMPAGTTIAASAIDATPSNDASCTVERVFGTPVPNISPGFDPSASLRTSHSVLLKDCAPNDVVSVTVKAPSGLETGYIFSVPAPIVTTPPPAQSPNNIQANAPSPAQIFVAGNGLAEESVVTFTVRNNTTPVSNQRVRVSILNNIGGVQIGTRGNTQAVELTSNAAGLVSVTVFAGSVPTPVRLQAELVDNPSIFAESSNLTIASGPPSQRFFSLSVDTGNLEGATLDGQRARVTVFAADRQGNAVPNGTVVNFTAEGGQIGRSCTLQANAQNISTCSVDLITQNPRPAGGRVSVLAYAEGTKDYSDNNGNNRFDAGDTLENIGNAYRDDDEGGAFNVGEFVVNRGVSGGTCPAIPAPTPGVESTCDNNLATTVRRQIVVMFSSSQARISAIPDTPRQNTAGRFNVDVAILLQSVDNPLLPMPRGTTISGVALENGCSVVETFPATVPNIQAGTAANAGLATPHLQRLDCAPNISNRIRVIVRTPAPSEAETTLIYTVSTPPLAP